MRRLVFGLVLVAVLLVGADRIALVLAERGVAESIQQEQHLARRPEVSIGGFPLLTQAVAGRYEQVDTTIAGLKADSDVTIDRLDLRLRGVRLPLSELTGGTVPDIRADSASAAGTVGYPSLNAAAKRRTTLPGLTFTFSRGSHGRLAVKGSYRGVVGLSLRGEASVSVRGRTLVLTPVSSSLSEIPAIVRGPLLRLIGGSYRLPPLPFGFIPRSVTVGPTGVTVRAPARDVVLQ